MRSADRASVAELLVAPVVDLVEIVVLNIGFDGRVVYGIDVVVSAFLLVDFVVEGSSDVVVEDNLVAVGDSSVEDFFLRAWLMAVRLLLFSL